MAKLTKEQILRIVERLACFEEPSEVAEAVNEEFGVSVTRQQVWTYDPTRPANDGRIAKDLRDLFGKTRVRFVAETEGIGIAHKRYRLERLQRMFAKAEGMRNYGLAASLLEQAAKEIGGAYTNRKELTGAGGGPIEQHHEHDIDLSGLSKEELGALDSILAKTAHGGGSGGAAFPSPN